MLKKLIIAFRLLILVTILTACSDFSEYTDTVISYVPGVNYFACSNLTTIKIRSTKCTNYGAPFYVLVKPTDFPTFLNDDYIKIAELVANPPEDQPGIEIFCVLPGKELTIEVETPDIGSLGIYFLFTHPGNEWKQYFDLKEGSSTKRFDLNYNEIVSREE